MQLKHVEIEVEVVLYRFDELLIFGASLHLPDSLQCGNMI